MFGYLFFNKFIEKTVKTCIITGASQGLGRCLATRFAAGGADLALCARNANELAQLATDLQTQYPNIAVFWQRCDMSQPADIAQFMQAAIAQARHGIGALINNVGAFELNRAANDPGAELLSRMLSLNLYAAYHSVAAVLPTLLAQQSGHIFNIESIAAIDILDDCAAYSISKRALHAYTQLLRRDLASQHVRVTGVQPGAMLTRSWEGATVPPYKIIPPEEVAELVWQCYQLSGRTVVENIVVRPALP